MNYESRIVTSVLKNICAIFLFLVFCFVFLIPTARAAELYFQETENTVGRNGLFEVKLFLNAVDTTINALEGKIVFPHSTLQVEDIRIGNSIISLWIEEPRTERGDVIGQPKEIFFSGIIPGGYHGDNGFLFSIIFRTTQEGEGLILVRDARVYLNDGNGTVTTLPMSQSHFSASQEFMDQGSLVSMSDDKERPETFNPEVARQVDIFDNMYFLVFATQDKGSGIDYYEVLETRNKRRDIESDEWIKTTSPYLLKDQELKSYIYVRAVDKAGNDRIIMISPLNSSLWHMSTLWAIIIVTLILGGSLRMWLLGKRRREIPNQK